MLRSIQVNDFWNQPRQNYVDSYCNQSVELESTNSSVCTVITKYSEEWRHERLRQAIYEVNKAIVGVGSKQS